MNIESGKVWIVGAEGRVGSAICKLLDLRRVELLKTDIEDVDITNKEDIAAYIDINRPDIIINCAGFTDVARCEKEVERAFQINAIGARNLSVAARKVRAIMVQISTDDVFDGKANSPYNEFDYTYPCTIYGKSKLAGENFVREFAPKHIIIRSSWVYGDGKNFVKQILCQAEEKKKIYVSKNQFASPTSAKELARTIIRLINHGDNGIYHAVCTGYCSRYEFAKEILHLSNKQVEVLPAVEAQSELTIMRPSYSVLDNLMLRINGIETPVDWRMALKEYIEELLEKK